MKEKYIRYSLISLILLTGYLIATQLWTFAPGLLGAITLYILVRRQMICLTTGKCSLKPHGATFLILAEVVTCVIAPLYLLVRTLLGRIQEIDLDITQLMETLRHLTQLIETHTGYNLLSPGNMETATGYLTRGLHTLLGQIGNLAINTLVILFLLYFMLLNRVHIETYLNGLLPFSEANKALIRKQIHQMVHANTLGIPLLAVAQGLTAVLGYWAAGIPSPHLYGILTAFATLIPLLGTGLVWVPLVVYLALTGHWVAATGLLAYSLLLLTNIDNLIRLLLQKKLADTHPLITLFGVILGLKTFGFWGLIFGPLLLSLFFLLLNIFKREYLDAP